MCAPGRRRADTGVDEHRGPFRGGRECSTGAGSRTGQGAIPRWWRSDGLPGGVDVEGHEVHAQRQPRERPCRRAGVPAASSPPTARRSAARLRWSSVSSGSPKSRRPRRRTSTMTSVRRRSGIHGDEVQLVPPDAEVAGEDDPARRLEAVADEPLGLVADPLRLGGRRPVHAASMARRSPAAYPALVRRLAARRGREVSPPRAAGTPRALPRRCGRARCRPCAACPAPRTRGGSRRTGPTCRRSPAGTRP